MPDTHVVGGGLAGAKAAEALRSEGFEGRVVLVAAEDELPYERPPLSKGYLRADTQRLIRSGASKDELGHRAQHARVGVHE